MKLGIDIDGVVNDLTGSLLSLVEEKHGVKISNDEITCYWIDKITFFEDEELDIAVKKTMLEKVCDIDFQTSAEAYPEAVKALRSLRKAGHSIYFLSNRTVGKESESKSAAWLKKYGLSFDGVKHFGTYGDKGSFAKKLDLDFYIDDHEENLEAIYKHKTRWTKGLGLLTRPWNANHIDRSRFIRFDTWEEILRHLGPDYKSRSKANA